LNTLFNKDNDLVFNKENNDPPSLPPVPAAVVFNLYAKATINPSWDIAYVAVFIR
jgi:hypothetical protein